MNRSPADQSAFYPRLFPDLRNALACLYSLPSSSLANAETHGEAHDFLMNLQSRNVRRSIQSMCQRHAQKAKDNGVAHQDGSAYGISNGSTWLACLALLCHANAHAEEGLFCAQTLMHRLRRTKLVEAIDVEIENLNVEHRFSILYQQVGQVRLWMPLYFEFMQRFHPLLFLVMNQRFGTINTDSVDEGATKGEISLLTLSVVTYLVAQSAPADARTNPILSTLGSSIAAIALRLRYTPMSVANRDNNTSGATTATLPLVTMVTRCFMTVSNAATCNNSMGNDMALLLCLSYSLAAIPDTILGSPGGARGRLSVDPRCVQVAHEELRNPATGIFLVMESIMPVMEPLQNSSSGAALICHFHLLSTCERWQKFLPLPMEFLQHTVPLAARYISNTNEAPHKPALAFLIAIFESATRTVEQILAASLGLGPPMEQANKKRQSSKSKKRRKERLDNNTTDARRAQAQAEYHHCGEVACHTAMLTWQPLLAATQAALASDSATAGEGPVGCLCACAHACLPHLVQQPPNTDSLQLFEAIAEAFRHVCCSNDRKVRALSYEPLFALHSAVIESARTKEQSQQGADSKHDDSLDDLAVKHLFQCAFHLATSCGYPPDYFMHLDADSDEDIEIQRNDIRDILRTLAGSEGGSNSECNNTPQPPLNVSIHILFKIVEACAQAIAATPSLPPETAVHTFSAVAKPLNHLAKSYASGFQTEEAQKTLLNALAALGDVCERLIKAIPSMPVRDVLPVSRLADLAIASLSPAISDISIGLKARSGSQNEGDHEMYAAFKRTIDLSIHASAVSIVHIPELVSESSLDQSQFDIRGAMRGPGGEDHVGCLALMRLTFESDKLANTIIELQGPSLILELCKLHEKLKRIEDERVPLVSHGQGVTPKSRRILLNTISRLGMIASHYTSKTGEQESATMQAASKMLTEIFTSCVSTVASLGSAASGDADRMFRVCETTFDLASFSPEILVNLSVSSEDTDSDRARQECLKVLFDAGLSGFSRLSISHHPDAFNLQWGRMRGALLALMRALASPDLSQFAVEAIVAWNRAECDAIAAQCQAGAQSISSVFHESVVGEECIPAGPFVKVCGEILEGAGHQVSNKLESFQVSNKLESFHHSIAALRESSTVVLHVLLLGSPEPVSGCYEDPRPALCEAWFLTMNALSGLVKEAGPSSQILSEDSLWKQLISGSCTTAVSTLLMQPLDRETDMAAQGHVGMTMDGAHTLAMMQFLEKSLSLGPAILRLVATQLQQRIEISKESVGKWSSEVGSEGIAVVGAALFRAASGGLPPWAVEDVPKVFSALFHACNKDVTNFGKMLMMATEARRSDRGGGFGAVRPGELLAGKYFESMSETSKHDFVVKALDVCSKDNAEGWRRFKVLLKQACGGKKKGSIFSLKPSPSSWECDRI